jgi:hypothetical protein
MTEAEKEQNMTVKKTELGPHEEAEPTTIEEVGQASREAFMAFGVALQTSLMDSRLPDELPPLIRQFAKGIAQDEAILKAHKIRTPTRRPESASRPVNSLIKQEKP